MLKTENSLHAACCATRSVKEAWECAVSQFDCQRFCIWSRVTFYLCYIAIIWTIHTHYISLRITSWNKLNVRFCFRWNWNQNGFVWICVVCLWKVQFIGFQSEVCKNTIFHGVYKLTSFHLNHRSQVVACADLTCNVLCEKILWICAVSIIIMIKPRFH